MTNHERKTGVKGQGRVIVLESQAAGEAQLPPWMFRHDNLIGALASAQVIEKNKLANTINYLHFKGEYIYALIRHPRYEENILVKIHPDPCLGDELTCRWDQAYSGYKLERYRFQYLVVSYEQSIIVIHAKLIAASSKGAVFKLPEQGHIISERLSPRFTCRNVSTELWQNGFQAAGELLDFNPHAFRISVEPALPSSFHWFNAEVPATIRLSGGKDIFFSGNCKCLHEKQTGRSREIVLAPINDQIKRFKAKALRNPRRQGSSLYHAAFEHPFTKKKVQREIFDISTSGFSIYDKSDDVLLMPGMIIPDMTIAYAGIFKINCKVQVIYRKEEDAKIRFGIAILDMDLINYNNLTQLLNNGPGLEPGATNEIDIDQLWELFFDTGFIYPEKYKHIQSFRDNFQETYRKLYEDAPEIARHFTYQKNGRIYSHVSILRAYEKAWLIHHHAARAIDDKYTGFIVLKQLIYYLNDVHRLPSANMDYVFCYFRPENKYNDRLYAGFAKKQNNAKVTSLDLFSYLTYENKNKSAPLPRGWSLQESSASDFWDMEQFYKHHSGGLLCNVLNLERHHQEKTLEKSYAQTGFCRNWKSFALNFGGDLKAVIVAEESDVGINLSDLLNGFKVFVIDPDTPADIIFTAIGNMATHYTLESLPLMIYPNEYTQNKGIKCEKQYYLWVLDMQHGSEYMKYLGRMFRMKLT